MGPQPTLRRRSRHLCDPWRARLGTIRASPRSTRVMSPPRGTALTATGGRPMLQRITLGPPIAIATLLLACVSGCGGDGGGQNGTAGTGTATGTGGRGGTTGAAGNTAGVAGANGGSNGGSVAGAGGNGGSAGG